MPLQHLGENLMGEAVVVLGVSEMTNLKASTKTKHTHGKYNKMPS
jgi:hypothetical protein